MFVVVVVVCVCVEGGVDIRSAIHGVLGFFLPIFMTMHELFFLTKL